MHPRHFTRAPRIADGRSGSFLAQSPHPWQLLGSNESWRKSRKLVEDRESNDSTVSNPQRRSPLSAYAFRRAQIPADMEWRTRRQGDVGYFGSTPEELDSLQFNMPVAVLDGHDDAKQPHHGPDSQRMIWWRQFSEGKPPPPYFFELQHAALGIRPWILAPLPSAKVTTQGIAWPQGKTQHNA